jgi:hypothetical protein
MRSMLKPEEWRRIQEASAIEERTLAPLMLGKPVSARTRRRVEAAAKACGIALPKGIFVSSVAA